MTIALISSAFASANSSANTSGATSGIDTTGANLIVCAVSWFGGGGHFANTDLSDSKGNSWTLVTGSDSFNGSDVCIALFYSYNPTVGSGHTFTAARTGAYPGVSVAAFSGVTSSPVDQVTFASPNPATQSIGPGSITPSVDNCLVVTATAQNVAGTISISNGITSVLTSVQHQATGEGVAVAYVVQTTAAAINPTWNRGAAQVSGTGLNIASFKPSTSTATLKTVDGLALASIKTVNSLAIASVKAILGLTTS